MPCHAMLCHARLNLALASPEAQVLDVNTPVCFNVASALDRSRTRAAATSRDGQCPSPADVPRALVPVPEVLRHGCCTSGRSPGRDGQTDEGFASSSCWWTVGNHKKRESRAGVAHSEPSASAPAPAHAPAPISLSTFSRAGPGPPQHPICGGPSVQRVVSESCVLWHGVPCTRRSTPLLQAAD